MIAPIISKDAIREKWFLSDIKTRILLIACQLTDDPNYNKEDTITDLIKITEALDC